MKHFLFVIDDPCSEYNGEEFVVGARTFKKALSIAKEYHEDENIMYLYELTDEEAEASGLDEY